MVAIIILNWNGWQDTIACLESLSKIDYNEYFVILGDNGSTNPSKERLSAYCEANGQNAYWNKIEKPLPEIVNRKIFLYDLQSNYGFAKGNNLLIQLAARHNPDYYLLLNNDTEVEPDFLTKLINYQRSHNRIKVLTPIIYYYDDKTRIWNAGGRLLWGIRKYHYADSTDVRAREKEFIPCSFITGCALFCTQDVLLENNKLFTESFFHGEEDFDFSLRMKDKGIKMGCVASSVIYHKVGRSSGSIGNKIGLTYCYYLNRFINLRHHLSVLSFYSFIIVYFPYVIRLLSSQGLTIYEAIRFYWKVLIESHKIDEVTYKKFLKCANKKSI